MPGWVEAGQIEQQADAEAHQDRGNDQAGDGEHEQRVGADEATAEREAGGERDHHRYHHDDQPKQQRTGQRATEVAHRLWLEQACEPVQRDTVHR
jgi:hypothetical protein